MELFGHQRFAGRVRQAEFPAGFLRLDVPATGEHPAVMQLIAPNAVYRLTPVDEAVATAIAARCRPEPVHRWELPAAVTVSEDTWRAEAAALADDEDDDPWGGDADDEPLPTVPGVVGVGGPA